MSEQAKKKKTEHCGESDPHCVMCSTKMINRYHVHWSTFDLRLTAICDSDQNEFLCPVCLISEKALQPESTTKKILLTDETFFGIWMENRSPMDEKDHFEIECIVRRKFRDLGIALKSNFLYLKSRLEIIVVGGLENVSRGDECKQIITEIEDIKEMVLRHSLINRHQPPSTITFCTLPLPPKLCSLHVPDDVPALEEWKPKPGFENKTSTIEAVNAAIKGMNEADGLKCVNLHWHGIKLLKKGKKQHKFDTRPGATRVWEEDAVASKLHFTMENKLKFLKFIVDCFRDNANKASDAKQ